MKNKLNNNKNRSVSIVIKELFTRNVAIKILSCICAILIWLLITNIADPYKTKSFIVEVETINDDSISSVNLVYEVKDGGTARVIVGGKRSVIDKIRSNDIVASADLSELSSVNAVPVKAKVRGDNFSDVNVECNDVLKVSLEKKEKKQIKVNVNTDGEPGGDYTVGDCIARPNVIEVTGGESVIEQIDTVAVSINVNGATENFSQKLVPVAYDKKGRKVTSETLQFNVERVLVKVKLIQKKTIPVKIQIKGEPAEGYEYTGVTSSPKQIEISGNRKLLSDISEVVLPVDISGLKDTSSQLEQNISAQDYLPAGVNILSEEDKNISIKVSVGKMETKVFHIPVSSIKLKDIPKKYEADIETSKVTLDVKIIGKKDEIKDISIDDLDPWIDCSNCKKGKNKLEVKMKMSDKYILSENIYLNVFANLKEDEEDKATPTPQVSETPVPSQTPDEE